MFYIRICTSCRAIIEDEDDIRYVTIDHDLRKPTSEQVSACCSAELDDVDEAEYFSNLEEGEEG